MKIRQNFVSNSSTCSFVVLGYCFKENSEITYEKILKALNFEKWEEIVNSEEYKREIEKYGNEEADFFFHEEIKEGEIFFSNNTEDGAPPGKVLIGYNYESDEYETDEYNIEEELDELYRLKGKLKGIVPEDAKISLINGIRMC